MNGDVHGMETPPVGPTDGVVQPKTQVDDRAPATQECREERSRLSREIPHNWVECGELVVEDKPAAQHARVCHCRKDEREREQEQAWQSQESQRARLLTAGVCGWECPDHRKQSTLRAPVVRR